MAAMQARLQPGANFLWLDNEPGRTEHVRKKGPFILPVGDHIPKRVPSGLIHDWLGAGFVPNARIPDILKVVRDYDHYAEVDQPGVIASKLNSTDGLNDSLFLHFGSRISRLSQRPLSIRKKRRITSRWTSIAGTGTQPPRTLGK